MTLVYFSPVPWDSYPQRPHHFVRYFLRCPHRRAIWVDPYPMRLPVVSDLRRRRSCLRTPRPEGLDVISLRALPVEPLPAVGRIHRHLLQRRLQRHLSARLDGQASVGLAIGRPSGLALAMLRTLPRAWSVYDAMDDFPEFYQGVSKRVVGRVERQIAGASDVILTSSRRLWDKFSAQSQKRVLVRNAFEMTTLPPVPARRAERPVLGYIGMVGAWFDWPVVVELARRVPDATVEVIGPRVTTPGRLPSNVRLLPECSHEDAVAHLRRFSVGLIPFRVSRLTDAIDPIKYYAYRAMGLPVLTTRFGEMRDDSHGDAIFTLDRGDPAPAVAAALRARVDANAVARFRATNDWERRFTDAGLFDRILDARGDAGRAASATGRRT